MPEASYPYTGGQGVTDAVYEQLMAEVTGNGRINLRAAGQSLSVPIVYADSSGRQAKVRANASYLIRGFRWDSNEGQVRSLDPNTSGNPRLDLIVLRLDRASFTVRVEVLKGAPAATPTLPAVTQQLGPTGRYEIPLASVRVAHNATNIISSDVTSYETWHAPPGMVGHSTQRPAVVEPGMIWTEYDTGRIFGGLASTWHLLGERSSYLRLSAASGWNSDLDYIFVQRANGLTSFWLLMYRAPGSADLAANVQSRLTTLPSYYAPVSDFYTDGVMQGMNSVRLKVEATTGYVTLLDHAAMKANHFVQAGPMTFPCKI